MPDSESSSLSRALAITAQDEQTKTEPKIDLKPGIGLCLSGGGFRATLFHLGALLRLNELGLLQSQIRCISSVSGGSITAGYLALKWNGLTRTPGSDIFPNFYPEVVQPLREFCYQNLDVKAVLGGSFLPGDASDWVVNAYKEHLFGEATLQDFPDTPSFILNATNVQSGALWRFSKGFMGDWKVGLVNSPVVSIAQAVAASSAFPPFLSPLELKVDQPFQPDDYASLQRPPFTTDVVLSDGGVYDNLGLEPVWKHFGTVLVSDAGMSMGAEASPHGDWIRHLQRVLEVIDNQVRCLRKRMLVGSLAAGEREGAYFSIRGDIADYPAPAALACPHEKSLQLAAIPTRLTRFETDAQEKLINWGYAITDAAVRFRLKGSSHFPGPVGFPHPIGIG